MTWKHAAGITLVILLVGGCVRSLHGLYTDRDLVFKPGLLGVWKEEGEQNIWTFTQSTENQYLLKFVQQGSARQRGGAGTGPDSATFIVHMVNLEGRLFLDFYPEEPEVKTELCKVHMLPVHTFWKIWIDSSGVRLAMLSHDWLKRKVDGGELKIQHERVNEEIVLTAPTEELQRMMVSVGGQDDAFAEPVELVRAE